MRFAPLIRVSTESQEKQGESLRTQKNQIQTAIEQLKGKVVNWKYCGQESATEIQERQIFDQLLNDCQNKLFDAVIVADVSRWSRNNKKSEEGIEILKSNGIKFFVLTRELNLFDPSDALLLRMEVLIGNFSASQGAIKSMMNRIERAKRNIPTGGQLPFGRTFDKATETWGTDKEKQKKIKLAAKLYLRGEKFPQIAKVVGSNQSHLYHILKNCCGNTYPFRISSKKYNIHFETTLKIPRLLPESTIKMIKEQLEGNKTYGKKGIKYKYLLARVLFCRKCEYAAYGFPLRGRWLYYSHVTNTADIRVNNCSGFRYIPAKVLEDAVMNDIFSMIDTPEKMEEAIRISTPVIENKPYVENELNLLERRKKEIDKQIKNLIAAVSKGLSVQDVQPVIEDLKGQKVTVLEQIENKKFGNSLVL